MTVVERGVGYPQTDQDCECLYDPGWYCICGSVCRR